MTRNPSLIVLWLTADFLRRACSLTLSILTIGIVASLPAHAQTAVVEEAPVSRTTPEFTAAEVDALKTVCLEARLEFREAVHAYLRSLPELTPEEETLARAEFVRANFDWRVAVAEAELAYRMALKGHPGTSETVPELRELESDLKELRGEGASDAEERGMRAYGRAARELLLLEHAATRGGGE